LQKFCMRFFQAMRLSPYFALAALVLALVSVPRGASADVEKRVALVIGNGGYRTAPQLENPPLDAKAVAASLKRLGFQVIEGYDLTMAQMRTTVAQFSAALPDAKAAIVYYAGHGVSVDEENYILPTDIVLKTPTDLDFGAISISLILKQMKRQDRVNVVILDACRDNPFAADLASSQSRSVVGVRGLSRVDADLARGTLIAFASDPKSTALDGPPGEHSPFTKALIDHLEDPGVSIDTVMNRVRSEVWETTKNKQLPWVNTSIIGEFSLNPQSAPGATLASLGTPASAPAGVPEKLSQENLIWESAQHSNLAGDYQAYLDAYPNGVFAPMAKNRIASLTAAPDPAGRVAPLAPDTSPIAAPAGLKAEIGTLETEKSLKLSSADRKEIQQRLIVLEFNAGPANGTFGEKTRAAIADWQKDHQATQTGLLGPVQLAALKAESEGSYRRFLSAQPMVPVQSAAPSRATQTAHRQPVQRQRAIGVGSGPPPGPADNGAGSAAAGAFFGGVASGLILHQLTH
jgi:Caspase domain/Putative peptidoglycan binding domain